MGVICVFYNFNLPLCFDSCFKNMKIKIIKKRLFQYILLGITIVLTFGVMEALALTTVLFTPVRVNVAEGQQFTVSVAIDPAGVKNYTAKIELQFPPSLLEVRSFLFDSGLIPLPQPGYDLINNSSGVVIKTAGYPGGVSSRARFGSATFVAKKTGIATIKVGGSSFVLDAQNQNVINTQPVRTIVTISRGVVVERFDIPEEIPDGYTFASELGLGDRSIDVAYVQMCLRTEGIYEGPITGYFGPLTEKSVALFQNRYSKDILLPLSLTEGTGVVERSTQEKLNELCVPRVVPDQLFDINLELENATISDISELVARVIFVSFGAVPTPVDLTFVIEDEDRNEVYRSTGKITVETEALFTQTFEELELLDGTYTVVLQTLYNTDVFDEFRQDFKIKPEEEPSISLGLMIYFIVAALGLIYIFRSLHRLIINRKIK